MATSRASVTSPAGNTSYPCGDHAVEEDMGRESPGRGTRKEGDGSNTPASH